MITTAILWKRHRAAAGPAKYGGEGGQQDRPQTRGCRINNSLSLIFLLFLLLYLFYQHNAVTDQHTAQAEQAD